MAIKKSQLYTKLWQACDELRGGIKNLVVDHKWMPDLFARFRGELDRTLSGIASEVKALAERYETPLPALEANVESLRVKVRGHLEEMGIGL